MSRTTAFEQKDSIQMDLRFFTVGGQLHTFSIDPSANLDNVRATLINRGIINDDEYNFYHHGVLLSQTRPLRDLHPGDRVLLVKRDESSDSDSCFDEFGPMSHQNYIGHFFADYFDAVMEIGQIEALYNSSYDYASKPELLQQVSHFIQDNPTNIAPIVFHEEMHAVRSPELNKNVISCIFTLLDLPLYELQSPSDELRVFYDELPRSQRRIFDEMANRGFQRDRVMRAMKITKCDREATIEELSSYTPT